MAISPVIPDYDCGDVAVLIPPSGVGEQLSACGRTEWQPSGTEIEHRGLSARPRPISASPLGRRVLCAALPLADLLALGAAIAMSRTAGRLSAGYAVAVLSVLAASRQHRLSITPRVSDQAGRIVVATVLPALGLLPWITAGAVIRLALLSAAAVGCGRAVAYRVLRSARGRGRLAEAAVIVGTGETAAELAGLMRGHAELGLRPVGFVGGDQAAGFALPLPLPVLGRAADLSDVIRRNRIRRVIVAFAAEGDAELLTSLRSARELQADICVVPRLRELGSTVPRCVLDEVWGIPLIPLRRISAYARPVKRAFDVAASLALLIMLGPLIAVFAVVTRVQFAGLRSSARYGSPVPAGGPKLSNFGRWTAPATRTPAGLFPAAVHGLREIPSHHPPR